MNSLGNPQHDMPFTPEVKLDPAEPVTDGQKDAALQEWVAENGF